MKQRKLFVILLLFTCVLPAICLYSQDNLIKNGDFEQLTGGYLSDWVPDTWAKDPSAVGFYIEHDHPHSGNTYITIENSVPTDSIIRQDTTVEPDTVYKLSCWIRVQGIDKEFKGANISILNTLVTSTDYYDTGNIWQYVELYGKTGPKQDQMTVAVRLGGYNHVNSGTASFDDFQMVKISTPPGNVQIFNFDVEALNSSVQLQFQKGAPAPVVMLLIIFSLVFIVLFSLSYQLVIKQKALDRVHNRMIEIGFAVFLLAAFLLRLILAPAIDGYPYDMGCFKTWSVTAFDNGLPNFYGDEKLSNYPPGYIYILYLIGLIRNLFALPTNSTVYLILLKTPSLLTDIIAAFLIYKISRKYTKSIGISAVLSLLYAFNPAIIHNSTIFGQIDSFFTLFILIFLMLIERKQILTASIFYVIAVLIKPQSLLLGPIVLVVLLESKNWRMILACLLSMLVTFIVLILPFTINKSSPFWILQLYQTTLGYYAYTTLNAFNIYALLGANKVILSQKFLFFSFRAWGLFFIMLILGFSVFIYFHNFLKRKNTTLPFYLSLFLITAFFMLAYMMHERYLYPAIILSLLCYIMINDRRFLFIFLGMSITLLFNQELVLYLAYNFDITLIAPDRPVEYGLMRIISFINLGLFVYLIKIGCDIYLEGKIIPVQGMTDSTDNASTQ